MYKLTGYAILDPFGNFLKASNRKEPLVEDSTKFNLPIVQLFRFEPLPETYVPTPKNTTDVVEV